MKNFISNLVAFAATVIFTMLVGMDVATVVTVFVAFFLVEHLMFEVYGHIKMKEMPSVKQWIQYALEFIALILVTCGINYRSMYTLIAGVLFVIAAIVMGFVVNKKVEKVEEEVEAATEEVKEEAAEEAKEEVVETKEEVVEETAEETAEEVKEEVAEEATEEATTEEA